MSCAEGETTSASVLAIADYKKELGITGEAGRMDGDEQLLRGRIYGCDHDDPNPGPLPARTYATLVGGPLDGLLLDITGWTAEELDGGVALATELSRWPGDRALYDPSVGEPRTPGPGIACPFHYCGDTP